MRLEEINDPNPKYINSVIIWGVKPIALLADAMITMQDDPDLIYIFGVMIQERCEDLEKCLLRLYGENQPVDVDQYRVDLIENAVLKENLIKKLAAMMGVNPEYVTHDREYSVDDLQLMVDFFKYLHKGESKHTESIKQLLALAARKSPDTGSAEKHKSTFDDHRFWEYVAQIKIDGHNPADILEAWLKEHNPEHLKDS